MSEHRTRITEDAGIAARAVVNGGLVAFPTETVYGLGADAFNERALKDIFLAKGRPRDNPLIVHVANQSWIPRLAREVTPVARAIMEAFFPGPITIILPKLNSVPHALTAGLDTVGIRMPDHPVALAFLDACGGPVAAPSANSSGRPSPTSWQDVFDDLNGRVDVILKGQKTRVGLESSVVDCTADVPVVLRPGSVTLEDLRLVCSGARMATTGAPLERSPGTRHRHYQPDADVVLIDEGQEIPPGKRNGYIGIAPRSGFEICLHAADVETYARSLFSFFRECERAKVLTIYCQRVQRSGIGRALMDRLDRAAAR